MRPVQPSRALYRLCISPHLQPGPRVGVCWVRRTSLAAVMVAMLFACTGDDPDPAPALLPAARIDWIAEQVSRAGLEGQYDRDATEATADLIGQVAAGERAALMRQLATRPEVARGMSRIAIAFLPDFSGVSRNRTTVEADGSLGLSGNDKVRFLELISVDEPAINGLSFAAGAYLERLMEAGLADDLPMSEVGRRSSELDGLLIAARYNADAVTGPQEYGNRQAASEAHTRYVCYGRVAEAVDNGVHAPVAGLNQAADQVIAGPAPTPLPASCATGMDIFGSGGDDFYSAYTYLSALIATGRVPADRMPHQWLDNEDGRPVFQPLHEFGSSQMQDLINLVHGEDHGIGGEKFRDYRNRYNPRQPFHSVADLP